MDEKTEITEEVKVEKKKGNGLFTLFACIMTGIIVFLATNIGYKASKAVDPDSPKKSEGSNVTETKCDVKEDDSVDATTTRAIKEKFANLFGASIKDMENNNYLTPGNLGDSSNWTILFENKMDEVNKTYFIISGMIEDTAYDYRTAKFKDNSLIEDIKTFSSDAVTVEAYEKSSFAYRYKNVFGTEPKYVDVEGCPGYYYDSANELYVSIGACGGDRAAHIKVYYDSVAKKDNNIIVTAYVGSETDLGDKTVVYKDYKADSTQVFSNKEETITDSNKTSFTKYEFTFEKASNGEYYYKSVAKAS